MQNKNLKSEVDISLSRYHIGSNSPGIFETVMDC